ncbi:alpha/beta hydrolase [Parasedimentitalea psychrophila]|uniref:Alpha/beta hydrolase n=1 Tax=Parasedimentitalea psychrophila TaxID=2997337 RepID=A0A9Y2P651_9RHOB|nr:alpha/beta hydrolase [Parasedimentitalea psychrophila]WIY24633.1 alpha/beta hydrolase [Parasedimentitalea psychrophila]
MVHRIAYCGSDEKRGLSRAVWPLVVALMLPGCGENIYNELKLMPSPTVYVDGDLDPFNNRSAQQIQAHTQLFYATDRRVAGADDKQAFYTNERGIALRTGVANVKMTPPAQDWASLHRITLAGERDIARTLKVSTVHEIGPMPFSSSDENGMPLPEQVTRKAASIFSKSIDRQLVLSGNRDVFIYVHGYNVDFEYPTLVSKELQHFLGYQGAFISYNWPATPSRLAYFRDLETASATRRNLRKLIEFVSDSTDARRIHLIGYSAGSRLVFEVAYQIALQNQVSGTRRARLGQVILIGSDLDRTYFIQALADGLLEGMDHLSIYMSGSDAALNISRMVFGRNRLGQVAAEGEVSPGIEDLLIAEPRLSLIDSSNAPGVDLGNGHWYFRSSPWTSSDIFVSLLKGLSPATRGLARVPGSALWQFPADYPDRLKSALTAE